MNNLEQRELYPYNAYGSDGGLFGLHQDLISEVAEMRLIFGDLCDRLGERALSRMKPENALLTPAPVSQELAKYMKNILGYEELPLMLDVGSVGPNDLCEKVLDNGKIMDSLSRWVSQDSKPVLNPRTYTPSSILLAQQLNIGHIHKPPTNISRTIDGIYPSLDYIENHPESKNNSKVLNYYLQQELDNETGVKLNPEGGCAYDVKGIIEIIEKLEKQGIKDIMIKADLSVDGMGNCHIDTELEKEKGIPFRYLDISQKEEYIRKKLRDKRIPLGSSAGVVVTEFLKNKIADPSFEIYCPPKEWNINPFVYYTCGMIIEKGGFAGSVIPDQAVGVPDHLKEEYKHLLENTKNYVLEFAKIKWKDGYVGVMDCDLGVRRGESDELSSCVLEYNLSRETGGTASYHLWQRIAPEGIVIARDSIKGVGFAKPISEIAKQLGERRLNGAGAVILGHRLEGEEGNIMSLVYGNDFEEAVYYDTQLLNCARGEI